MSQNIYNIAVQNAQSESINLERFQNKVLLIVNVASKCGLTPQYEGLQKLYEQYKTQGLEIVGFPANNFKQQEPNTDAEIQQFCQVNYGVTFSVLAKISVVGEDQHPIYHYLTRQQPERIGEGFAERLKGFGIDVNEPPEVLWNFEKFLVSRKGDVIARFAPNITADDPQLIQAIETALAT
jgi:glutathione peroxidase